MAEPPVLTGSFRPLLRTDTDQRIWAPMIDIEIGLSSPQTNLQNDPVIPRLKVTALIDTGAAYCFVKNEVAKRISLPEFRRGPSVNFDDVQQVTTYTTFIFVRPLSRGYTLEVVGKNLNEVDFDVVLGWNFLWFYTLQISRDPDMVSLTHRNKAPPTSTPR